MKTLSGCDLFTSLRVSNFIAVWSGVFVHSLCLTWIIHDFFLSVICPRTFVWFWLSTLLCTLFCWVYFLNLLYTFNFVLKVWNIVKSPSFLGLFQRSQEENALCHAGAFSKESQNWSKCHRNESCTKTLYGTFSHFIFLVPLWPVTNTFPQSMRKNKRLVH